MNEKMGESYLNGINTIGTLLAFLLICSSIIKRYLTIEFNNISLVFSLMYTIYIFFATLTLINKYYNTKKMFISLYSLSINNKLHPQREFVVINHDDLLEEKIPFSVNKALFIYTILKENNKIDVIYNLDIDLELSTIRFFVSKYRAKQLNRNTFPYFFYIILDSLKEIDINSINITVIINDKEKILLPLRSVTISSEDDMYDKEGLYKVSMELPISFFRLINNSRVININISYVINDNFKICPTSNEYTFTVIPGNYGNSIKNINFEVKAPVDDNYTINCYEAGVAKSSKPIFEKCLDFECSIQRDSKRGFKIYKLLDRGYNPNRNSIYCIRLMDSDIEEQNYICNNTNLKN